MPVFTKERTARKAHKCSRCLGQIRPGERYAAYSIPPNSEFDNIGWLSGHEHLDVNCIRYQDEPPAPEDWTGLPLKEENQ
jgi:hypothetical protein